MSLAGSATPLGGGVGGGGGGVAAAAVPPEGVALSSLYTGKSTLLDKIHFNAVTPSYTG